MKWWRLKKAEMRRWRSDKAEMRWRWRSERESAAQQGIDQTRNKEWRMRDAYFFVLGDAAHQIEELKEAMPWRRELREAIEDWDLEIDEGPQRETRRDDGDQRRSRRDHRGWSERDEMMWRSKRESVAQQRANQRRNGESRMRDADATTEVLRSRWTEVKTEEYSNFWSLKWSVCVCVWTEQP